MRKSVIGGNSLLWKIMIRYAS